MRPLVLALFGLNFGLDGFDLRLELGIGDRNWGIYLGITCTGKGLDWDLLVLSWDWWVFEFGLDLPVFDLGVSGLPCISLDSGLVDPNWRLGTCWIPT